MSHAINSNYPDGWEAMEGKKESRYWNPSKFELGETVFRIMCKPITGWVEHWKDEEGKERCAHYRPLEKPREAKDPTKGLKKFWAFTAWDYAREDIYLMKVTQSTIYKEFVRLIGDPKWGALTDYDIKVFKSGQKLETKYMAIPCPNKAAPEIATMTQKATIINLEALYTGDDPFSKITHLKQ